MEEERVNDGIKLSVMGGGGPLVKMELWEVGEENGWYVLVKRYWFLKNTYFY